MKNIHIVMVAFALAFAVVAKADDANVVSITTNLVVYTDVHSPSNTYNYFGTKLRLTIKDGLIVGCTNEGVFDLYNGKPAEVSLKESAERRADYAKKRDVMLKQREALKQRCRLQHDDNSTTEIK